MFIGLKWEPFRPAPRALLRWQLPDITAVVTVTARVTQCANAVTKFGHASPAVLNYY